MDEQRAKKVLELMRGLTVEEKLRGIEEARKLNETIFHDGMTDQEWALASMQLEQQYNLLREILKVEQIRIKRDTTTEGLPKIPTPKVKGKAAAKPKPQLVKQFDFASMQAEMQSFMKAKGGENE